MSNNLVNYNFNDNQVRTTTINDKPYFCLSDVCKALSIKNQRGRACDPGVEKVYIGVETGKKRNGTPAIQNIELSFINEPNLYRLIFRSNKPEAQRFADWVYSEVLPSIRKTGSYSLDLEKKEPELNAKTIGGIVKRCCGAAIREELGKISPDEILAAVVQERAAEIARVMIRVKLEAARKQLELL